MTRPQFAIAASMIKALLGLIEESRTRGRSTAAVDITLAGIRLLVYDRQSGWTALVLVGADVSMTRSTDAYMRQRAYQYGAGPNPRDALLELSDMLTHKLATLEEET